MQFKEIEFSLSVINNCEEEKEIQRISQKNENEQIQKDEEDENLGNGLK